MQFSGFDDKFDPEKDGEEQVAGFKCELPPGVSILFELMENSFAFFYFAWVFLVGLLHLKQLLLILLLNQLWLSMSMILFNNVILLFLIRLSILNSVTSANR